MYPGIADTINRNVAKLICEALDRSDLGMPIPAIRWHLSAMADTLLSDAPAAQSDRAWLVGFLAQRVPEVDFDGTPADCDWENLFSHFRAEIEARRDPETPLVRAALTPCGMV